jgi:hypothetical protein
MQRSTSVAGRLLAMFGICWALLAAGRDDGLRVQIDLERFELSASDPRGDAEPLRLAVATGSPAHPSPRGRFRPWLVVRNPAWRPGPVARSRGAEPIDASGETPMGVAKIALDRSGFALHGGADPLLLGKPVSLGCLRLSDADMLRLLEWLDQAGALAAPRPADGGELHQWLRRPVTFEVR